MQTQRLQYSPLVSAQKFSKPSLKMKLATGALLFATVICGDAVYATQRIQKTEIKPLQINANSRGKSSFFQKKSQRKTAAADSDFEATLDSDLDSELRSESDSIEPKVPIADSKAKKSSSTYTENSVPLGEDVEIKDLVYDSKLNGGTIRVVTTGAPSYRTREVPEQNQVIVEIANAKLPERLKRPFNTKDFKQALVSMNAYQASGSSTTRIVLQYRTQHVVEVKQDGSTLIFTASESNSRTANLNTNKSRQTTASKNSDLEMSMGSMDSAKNADVDTDSSESFDSNEEVTGVADKGTESGGAANGKIMPSSTVEEDRLGAIKYYGKPISIEVRDTPIREIIGLISEQSGANIIMSDDIQGNVSIKLKSVPWDQALAIIMRSRSLGYVRQGSILRIAPLKVLQAETDEARKILEAQEATQPLKVKVLPVSFANVQTLVSQVKNTLQKANSSTAASRGSIEADARSSSLIVTDTDGNIKKIEQLIAALDTPPLQVMIEGKIVEAKESASHEFGIKWGYSGSDISVGSTTLSHSARINPPQAGADTSVSLKLGTLDILGDLDAQLSFLERNDQARVVSSPRVITMNAQLAKIEQSVNIGVASTTQTIGGPAITTTSFRPIPTSLSVTPQITTGGDVIMNINFKREFQAGQVNGQPSIESRDVATNVMVKNGQTAVIGGIYQSDVTDSESGTPFFSKIPVLGWLFKSRTNQQIRNELLVFLTPRILNADRTLPKNRSIK